MGNGRLNLKALNERLFNGNSLTYAMVAGICIALAFQNIALLTVFAVIGIGFKTVLSTACRLITEQSILIDRLEKRNAHLEVKVKRTNELLDQIFDQQGPLQDPFDN